MVATVSAGTGPEVIIAAFVATVSAQWFKGVWFLLKHGRLNFKVLFHTGGMPSSHSAGMTAMAVSVGLIEGFGSVVFAVALGVAMVVMYDAAGVRRAAGQMAGVLNKMTEDLYAHHPEYVPGRLRELLGHTPTEVFVGSLWGAVVAMMFHQ